MRTPRCGAQAPPSCAIKCQLQRKGNLGPTDPPEEEQQEQQLTFTAPPPPAIFLALCTMGRGVLGSHMEVWGGEVIALVIQVMGLESVPRST